MVNRHFLTILRAKRGVFRQTFSHVIGAFSRSCGVPPAASAIIGHQHRPRPSRPWDTRRIVVTVLPPVRERRGFFSLGGVVFLLRPQERGGRSPYFVHQTVENLRHRPRSRVFQHPEQTEPGVHVFLGQDGLGPGRGAVWLCLDGLPFGRTGDHATITPGEEEDLVLLGRSGRP